MVELILIIAALVFGCKYILFNVKINSIIFIIFGILAISLKPPLVHISGFSVILILIAVADCIYDMAIADKFYKNMSDGIDGYFAAKSLATAALFLLGWFAWDKTFIYAFLPRVVFLCIIQPIIAANVKDDVRSKMESGYPLPYSKWQYSSSEKENYYYQRFIQQLFDEGKLVTNIKTVIRERDISRKRLDKSYPQKFIDVFRNTEQKKKRKEIEAVLSDNVIYKHAAYINSEVFKQYGQRIEAVLNSRRSSYCPNVIKKFPELQDLHLTAPNGISADVEWSEYFIIDALKKLIKDGAAVKDFQDSGNPETEDQTERSNYPLDNHIYGTKIKSNNRDNDPDFADLNG